MNKRKIKKAIKRLVNLPRGKYFFLYASNKIRHFYYKLSKSTRVAYPSTIMLELTNHCNLSCITCPREYAYGKAMSKGNMDINEAFKVIDELWPYLDSVGLTGLGETFIYKDIAKIVDYIKLKNKGIIISVSTNAVLPNFIESVQTIIGKIDTIQVSIDGLEDVYNRIRLKSDFNILDANLRQLVQLAKGTDTEIMLNMVVVKENYFEMSALVEYAKEIGVKYMDFSLFNLASVTDLDVSYYDFYKSDEFRKQLILLEETILKYPEVVVSERDFDTKNSFQRCPFPWSHYYISWDGFVPPCCGKPFPKEKNFGNVKSKSVLEVLNSESYENFRKAWFRNEHPTFCNKCNFVNIPQINK